MNLIEKFGNFILLLIGIVSAFEEITYSYASEPTNFCAYQYPSVINVKYPIIKTFQVRIPNCKQNNLSICFEYKTKTIRQKVYEIVQKRVYRTRYRCCIGWSLDPRTKKCNIKSCNDQDCLNESKCNNKTRSCVCSKGFTGPQCQFDINECGINNGNCSHECINTFGSYKCVCRDGYSLANDNKSCIDINECSDKHLNTCEHRCVNLNGSYRCECDSGYKLIGDLHQCQKVKSFKKIKIFQCEPFKNSTHNCTCVNEVQKCHEYKVMTTKAVVNLKISSNSAECKPGYWGYKCSRVCPPGRYGKNCLYICNCSSNSLKCNHINGKCICKPGYYGMDCKTKCEKGYYGFECKNKCIKCKKCHYITGRCYGKQPKCNCKNEGICLKDGSCLCSSGYHGKKCQLKCPNGFYGNDCANKCMCLNSYNCSNTNGTCFCLEGYYGKHCELKKF